MATSLHPSFSSTPDTSVSSASRVATDPGLKKVDRQIGWLEVGPARLRFLRPMAKFFLPKPDDTGVSIAEEPTVGHGCVVVKPDQQTGDGALLLIHGGGFVLGSNREVVANATYFARQLGVPVICPGYRLAPEHPFPAALDDCHTAWRWLQDNAASLGADPQRMAIGGMSAGGGLAAGLIQRLHDEGGEQPAAQLLVYPMLDDRVAANSALDKPRHRCWSNTSNRFGWSSYLGQDPGQATVPPYAVPGRREDLSGLPPAWIGVGTADLFLDEDRDYAERLTAAGVSVTYVEVAGAIHGFDAVESDFTAAFHQSQADFLGPLIATHTSPQG